MKYDIFISYRRDAFESANLIAEKLRSAGYTVFFDVETLRSGKFNEQLLAEIGRCTDFIVVLPEGGLDRCADPEDWVRREVCCAMSHDKNVIPVMLAGFQWPKPMPEGMEELANYQAITASGHEYFDLAMKRLMGYLKSRPHGRRRGLALKVAAVVAVLAVCAGIGYYAFRLAAVPVCTEVASVVTQGMGVMNLLGEDNGNLRKEWEAFARKYGEARTGADTAALKSDLRKAIAHYRGEISRLYEAQPTPTFETGDYRTFLLGLYGVNSAELGAFTQSYQSMFDELNHQLDFISQVLDSGDLSALNLQFIDTNFQGFQYLLNSLYYGYMDFLSPMPAEAQELHGQLSPEWNHFPNGVGLKLSKEEYERFQKQEANKYEALLKDTEVKLVKADSDMGELEEKLDNIEHMVTEAARQGQTSADEELANRVKAVEEKRAYVEEQKEKLAEIDRQYAETYRRMKEKCQLDENDEQSYMWGKIVHWAKFMNTIVESRKAMEAQGVYSTSSVTPEVALADMNSLLNCYQTYHPESKAYIPSMKAFYGDVVRGVRPLAGVLVFGFKDDAVHPLLKAGDIVVGRNGKDVAKYADLQEALKEKGDGSVVFLRPNAEGQLERHEEKMPDTKILVGYMELTE